MEGSLGNLLLPTILGKTPQQGVLTISVILHDSKSTVIFLKGHENKRQGFFVRSKRPLVNTATLLLETLIGHKKDLTQVKYSCGSRMRSLLVDVSICSKNSH